MSDDIPYGKIQWSSLRLTLRPFQWSNEFFVPGHVPCLPTYRLGPFEVSWFQYPSKEEIEALEENAAREQAEAPQDELPQQA